MNLLEVQNISKDFVKNDDSIQNVLSGISFTVKKGECFSIIGPNGSGKTTLLRILGLVENPTDGKILYLGKEMTNLSRKEKTKFRRRISFVRQKPVVINSSVEKNIAYGLKVRGVEEREIQHKTKEIIEAVGLKGLEKKKARALSGGEMQRVAIAMNFIVDPEIYLLDEVSANLDPKNITLLEEFITSIKEDRQKTIIMSTHDRMEAIRFADRIAVLNNGSFTQIGTPNEIFIAPKDEFTALFVGYENILYGIAELDKKTGLSQIQVGDMIITASDQQEGNVKVCIRPESIGIVKQPPKNTSYRNTFKGKIENIRDLGNICHIIVISGSEKFLITITELSKEKLDLKIGSEVFINFKATDVKIL
ncbi:MAG: ABC transporter ATP-binding protein [Promethearchaeota archaeon]|jgi:molybdopterin-binding protein